MKITEHFSVHEFDQQERHGFAHEAYPGEWVSERLHLLCLRLEAIRAVLGGRPMRILSGYRSPGYNRQIGGAKHSQHMVGRAADIVVAGSSAEEVHRAAREVHRGGMQIGGLGLYQGFVHVDVREVGTARWTGRRADS